MESERIAAEALLSAFDPPLSPDMLLHMEINLHLPEKQEEAVLYIALRIGVKRMYVVRNLPQFLRARERSEAVSFGKGFTYEPGSMRFEAADEKILSILSEVEAAQRPCEALGYTAPQNGKFLPLGEKTALRVLHILMARPFRLIDGKEIVCCEPITLHTLAIGCSLYEEMGGIAMDMTMPGDVRPIVSDFTFVYSHGMLWQLSTVQRRVVRALMPYVRAGKATFRFMPKETELVISEIMPRLEPACQVTLSEALAGRIRRETLKTQVYIDRDGIDVVVRVAFGYGDTVIDPFARAEMQDRKGPLLVRDAAAEHAVLDSLAHAGFHVREGRIYLSSGRRVLAFVQEGVVALQKVAEVFASEAFRKLKPRRPQLSGRLGMAGNALELTLYDGDAPIEEIASLMQALRDRKRYFRLKDGDFLDLSEMDQWDDLATMVGDISEADMWEAETAAMAGQNAIVLRAFRSAYLVSLLESSRLPIQMTEDVKTAAAALSGPGDPCPIALAGVLRPYQERGFQWIQSLSRLNMGGVLADDMGLGKTIQVITAMLWAKEKEGAMPSLVVAPTSLVFNWQAELERFAPSLSTEVLEGSQPKRALRWEELTRRADTDVIITSYPLLRRDIDLIVGCPFRFVVLDEAQHIKNPQSLAALSADRLQGQTRLALTGTPMENNPGELWSIFNFVLPGYLLTLSQFMRRHGDGGGTESLRKRIRPFLLRRLKADVLPELPEKIESRVLADMPPQQRLVYQAAAQRLRERVERVLEGKGLGRGRMEVLSAITQLRQICCHPALVLEGYSGSSGKLDALTEILTNALSSGRRVLLFSQFTSMLAILKRNLEAERIKTLYLDGKTPVVQRMELVNRFNDGEGQVFLISLKAGGAGLNLTGADMVIHYDPWWNPAAEDQATDRAHRIGQKRVVQVIRLITRGTIEEQVARLSERKRALFDAVVTAGEQMPTDLTESEIMSLFA